MQAALPWIDVIPASQIPSESLVTSILDAGERAAIDVALGLKADLLLMDERAGIEEARRLGLSATGTLGILARGAERGFINLAIALEKLRQTNFRIRPEILQQLLLEDASRPKRPM
jgi:predicted nucleic acid-binding protein